MSPYAHKVSGKWYLSEDVKPQPQSVKEYKAAIRRAYGSLRGVTIAQAGKDYDSVSYLVGNPMPTKNGRYI